MHGFGRPLRSCGVRGGEAECPEGYARDAGGCVVTSSGSGSGSGGSGYGNDASSSFGFTDDTLESVGSWGAQADLGSSGEVLARWVG